MDNWWGNIWAAINPFPLNNNQSQQAPSPSPTSSQGDPWVDAGFTPAGGGYYKRDANGRLSFVNKGGIDPSVLESIESGGSPGVQGATSVREIQNTPTPTQAPTSKWSFKRDKPATPTPTPTYRQINADEVYQPSLTPTPTPTPNPNPYRHPRWDQNREKFADYYQQLLSGTGLAHQKYPRVPQELLMDIAMIESGGRPISQHGGPAQGYFQFEPSTLAGLNSTIDPYSATQSAELAAQLINSNQLSRWGTPGGTWGSLDASRRNPEDRLTSYYSPEELNQFLADQYQIR